MNPVDPKPYLDAIPSIRSPLDIVAFALVCCTVALATASCWAIRKDPFAFKWVIHAFLGLFGAFVLMVVFCPVSVLTFHERLELAKANVEIYNNPWVVVASVFLGLVAYMVYYCDFWKRWLETMHKGTPRKSPGAYSSGAVHGPNYKVNISTMIEEIKKVQLYYQEFHHKCISWYVTIMGFFIAGAIVVETPAGAPKEVVGYSIVICSSILSLLFFLCLFHYGKRIEILEQFILEKETPTNDWYEKSKKVFISIHGVGSWFFFSIILVMQGTVIWITVLKYLC